MSIRQDIILDGEIDLRRYAEIMWRRRRTILAVVGVAVLVVLTWTLLTPRQWRAMATIMVPEPPKTEQVQIVGGIQASLPAVAYSQATYARLLKSTVILEMTAQKLKAPIPVDELARRISAKPVRDTRLIEVTATARSPQQAAAIATAVAESLVEYDREVISAELTQARQFVENQLVSARLELQATERALKEFAQQENLAALEAEVNRRLANLSSLRQASEQNRLEWGVASRRLAQLKRELASTSALRLGSTSSQTNYLNASVAAQLRAKLADLEAQRAVLLEQYTPSHPSVIAIDAQIARMRSELTEATTREPRSQEMQANSVRSQLEAQKAALQVEVAGLQARDRLLSEAIQEQQQIFRLQNARLAERRAEFNRLTREAETSKSVYATLSAKATEAVVAEGMKSGFVRLVDRSAARPVPKGTVTKALVAAILGFLGGLLAAFVTEHMKAPAPSLQIPLPGMGRAPSPRVREEVEA